MNEEKYYTPSIEDFRVGYECEFYNKKEWHSSVLQYGIYDDPQWGGLLISMGDGDYWYDKDSVRTPYLTKEQIEAEGWSFDGCVKGEYTFYKGTITGINCWMLVYDKKDKSISICDVNNKSYNSFYGSCPSINELRYISKLLNIK